MTSPPDRQANNGAPDNATRLLLSIDEAAAALSVSPRTLKRMVGAHELPAGTVVHLGRRRLFARRALEAWVAAGCPAVTAKPRLAR